MAKNLYGKDLYVRLVAEQRKWIEKCENSPNSSYNNPNRDVFERQAIKRADEAELRRLEEQLASYR